MRITISARVMSGKRNIVLLVAGVLTNRFCFAINLQEPERQCLQRL